VKRIRTKKPLQYSEEFREAVLSAFPSSERIRRMLDENSFSLGYSLSEGGISSISPSIVISLLEAGQQEELLKVARDAVEKKRLYDMWKNEVYE
jgi:hypothetical protein